VTAAGNDLRLAGLVVGHWMRAVVCAGVLAVTTGCASVFNEPINAPLAAGQSAASMLPPDVQGDTAVALAFSGGGTRAAAFAYGVMRGLDRMRGPDGRSHMDRLIFVSGVSGGSVAAAYVGLKGKAALSDFRERFLLRNAEEDLATSVNLRHLVRGLSGGVNDASRLPVWLDKNLFDNATMGDLQKPGRPVVWINASDLYNRTPFHFSPPVFAALCSDIRGYPLSQAVAASAAVPVAFAPIVLETFPDACTAPLPPWVDRVLADPGAGAQVGAQVRAFAQALLRYRDPGQVRYVKLVDGGLTDNFGLSGLVIARAIADTPYMPFTPDKAVQLSRLVFVVVNAGRAPEGDWARSVEGPSGAALLTAVTDTAIDSAVRSGFDAFRLSIREWEEATRRWRCRLSAAEAKRLGAGRNWRCSHLKFEVAEVSFDQLDPARMALVATVPTRFNLPAAQVDMVIDAGTDLVLTHPVFKGGVVRANARISQQVDATIR
jgi:NTE family protein